LIFNTKIKLGLLSLILLIPLSHLFGQDIHFSQFDKNPLYLNPANTGLMSGDCRWVANYRSQWGSVSVPFITPSFSYEKKKYIGKDYLGWGFHFLADQSGTNRYRHTALSMSGSYMKVIQQKYTLSFGAQVTGAYDYVSYNLTFDQTYDDALGDFNVNLNTGESTNNELPSILYPDVNAGMIFAKNAEDWNYTIGGAFHHIIRPNNSFINRTNNFSIQYKYSLHGSLKKKIGNVFYIEPKVLLLLQGVNRELMIGSHIGAETAGAGFHLGFYARRTGNTSDAFVPVGGITYGQFDFNLSYDINVSSLIQASDALGGYEVSIIYNCASSKIYKVSIPCRRY
jgi:type IX secretion system PorP/SprF family membrane protein